MPGGYFQQVIAPPGGMNDSKETVFTLRQFTGNEMNGR
jgi:hypothetical protein